MHKSFLMTFCYIGLSEKLHKFFLMSFSYKGIAKNAQDFFNEFLWQAWWQTDSGTAVQIDIHSPPLDKRYSPIISSICGPNNNKKAE